MSKFNKRIHRLVVYFDDEVNEKFHCLVYHKRGAKCYIDNEFANFFSKDNLIKTASHMIDLYPNFVVTVSAFYLGDKFGKYDLNYCSFFDENTTESELSVIKDFEESGLKLSPIVDEDYVLLTKPNVGEISLGTI